MEFRRLRLAGFKSFAEPTEILIEPGLTGVVGPNGCGKSNIVEALRWGMGESSARQLRGAEMDDVIFAGTSARPARNIAEVSLLLDNRRRRAPASFNDSDEIEIVRRIARQQGSAYRINGREARARDVQLLFADAASGARSSAIVSQGQIGAFIAAAPAQRRAVLEEAAGISGLHGRRHEAELRLKATEANLERVEDVRTALDNQLQGLRKQARQAARYRRLSELIREAEADLLRLRWHQVSAAVMAAELAERAADARVAETAATAARAATAQADASLALPALREQEARLAAELQRHTIARDNLTAEATRLAGAARAAANRLRQIEADMAREADRTRDAAQTVERLTGEQSALVAAGGNDTALRVSAQARLKEAEAALAAQEAEAAAATEALARLEASRQALERQIGEAEARRQRLERQQAQLVDERVKIEGAGVPADAVPAAERASAEAEEAARAAAAEADAAAEAAIAARDAQDPARRTLQAAEAEITRLQAEIRALQNVMQADRPGKLPPVLDAIEVTPGYELALGAALGEELSAPADAAAALAWRTLPPLEAPPPLPHGVEPLAPHVKGVPALARRLSQIGIVPDAATGNRLQPQLIVGQRLAGKAGGLWRWDGFTMLPGAPTAAARRLEQRNRLTALRGQLPPAESIVAEARTAVERVRQAADAAAARDRAAREQTRRSQGLLAERRQALAVLMQRAAIHGQRLAAQDDALRRIADDLAAAAADIAKLMESRTGLADPREARGHVDRLRATVAEHRAALLDARSTFDRIERDREQRQRRLAAIADELKSWNARAADVERQAAALAERAEKERAAVADLSARPAQIEATRDGIVAKIEAGESARRAAADALAAAETALAARDAEARDAEAKATAAREARIRAEATTTAAVEAARGIAERIRERLDCRPEALGALPEGPQDENALQGRFDRLLRERDGMGPVNLRAEDEVAELEAKLATLLGERDDLIAAIAKLRRAIADLNREGRERLVAAFEQVNGHFKTIFTRLFGGGQAHLTLTESDDPLDAGLDILAAPPGKKPQMLTLLSGGERALTALSLLFAVFLTNPAPVCVLDEVDAPLDDANVDRVCMLIEEIAQVAKTRFLVITHHRLTMARMDRLYGVTMPERGISQLVSVDLRSPGHVRAAAE